MPKSFTCQTPGCGERRTYDRAGALIVVDPCQHCGDPGYSIEDVQT